MAGTPARRFLQDARGCLDVTSSDGFVTTGGAESPGTDVDTGLRRRYAVEPYGPKPIPQPGLSGPKKTRIEAGFSLLAVSRDDRSSPSAEVQVLSEQPDEDEGDAPHRQER